MDLSQVVIEVAGSLMLLDENNELLPLDSLTMVDLVTGLEQRTGITLPTSALRITNFSSVERVVALLRSAS